MNHWNEENELKIHPETMNLNWVHDDCEKQTLLVVHKTAVEMETFMTRDSRTFVWIFVVPITLRRGVDIRPINPN